MCKNVGIVWILGAEVESVEINNKQRENSNNI
jgi:hypothetical protein